MFIWYLCDCVTVWRISCPSVLRDKNGTFLGLCVSWVIISLLRLSAFLASLNVLNRQDNNWWWWPGLFSWLRRRVSTTRPNAGELVREASCVSIVTSVGLIVPPQGFLRARDFFSPWLPLGQTELTVGLWAEKGFCSCGLSSQIISRVGPQRALVGHGPNSGSTSSGTDVSWTGD